MGDHGAALSLFADLSRASWKMRTKYETWDICDAMADFVYLSIGGDTSQ